MRSNMSLLVLAGLALVASPAHSASLQPPLPGSKNVIVQMFQWSWDSLASECTTFLGPAGFGYVQVSPPQETIQGAQWWTDYQPVSYTLTGKRGDRSRFANMVSTCHIAGVKVIVDAVWNHMSSGSGTGTAGDVYSKYNYPNLYSSANFHYCGLEPNNQILNYGSSQEVWTCELSGLADLATNTEYVRVKLAAYGNDLVSLGVDGFRLDAAKHQNPKDIANVLSRLSKKVYITQETMYGANEAVQASMYTPNGAAQEFRYTTTLMNAFNGQNGGIASLQNLDNRGWVASASANVFVANHDTERSGNSLNYQTPSNEYTNAMVFSLAHPYGTPSILSSYQYSSYDAGAPNNNAGTCYGSGGVNGWLCQHRWTAIAGMVGFRNNVSGSIENWVSPQSNQIAFGRGFSGYVIINNADSAWSSTFATPLSSGTYCDVISGATTSSTSCSGSSYTVSSAGTFSATIPARSAIAIHIGQKITRPAAKSMSTVKTSTTTSTTASHTAVTSTLTPTTSTVQVTFAPTVSTVWGENVFVVGSIPQLGNWAPGASIALSSESYPVWKTTLGLPAGTSFHYKYIKKETDGSVVWESDPNRQSTTGTSGSQILSDSWR